MKLSNVLALCSASVLAFALQANAVVINGVNYKQFTGSGSKCPDGSSVVVYKNAKYCKAYRANISWTIPTKRTNGVNLPISELKGYEVYWTRASDNAKGTIRIASSTQASTALDVYTPGAYYFAVSAIDTSGLKSPLSTMVQANLGN